MQPVRRATETIQFIPKGDRELPEAEQTIIKLRPMTLQEQLAALDASEVYIISPATGERIARDRSYMSALEGCVQNIADVINFPPGEAKPWPKDGDVKAKLDYLEAFPESVIMAIHLELITKSKLPSDAKN